MHALFLQPCLQNNRFSRSVKGQRVAKNSLFLRSLSADLVFSGIPELGSDCDNYEALGAKISLSLVLVAPE
jgi:hypothetical protein